MEAYAVRPFPGKRFPGTDARVARLARLAATLTCTKHRATLRRGNKHHLSTVWVRKETGLRIMVIWMVTGRGDDRMENAAVMVRFERRTVFHAYFCRVGAHHSRSGTAAGRRVLGRNHVFTDVPGEWETLLAKMKGGE